MKQISQAQAALLVKKFNSMFPVGAECYWRSIGKDGVPFDRLTVRSIAYVSNGQPVVFFEGKSGYCSIEPRFVSYTHIPPGHVEIA